MRWLFAAPLLAIAVLGGCRGDAQKCEQAARNYATLTYWKKADAEIAKLPADQQALAREKKLSKFTNELEKDINFFVGQCQSANNEDQIDCMIAAKTADAAAKCAELTHQ